MKDGPSYTETISPKGRSITRPPPSLPPQPPAHPNGYPSAVLPQPRRNTPARFPPTPLEIQLKTCPKDTPVGRHNPRPPAPCWGSLPHTPPDEPKHYDSSRTPVTPTPPAVSRGFRTSMDKWSGGGEAIQLGGAGRGCSTPRRHGVIPELVCMFTLPRRMLDHVREPNRPPALSRLSPRVVPAVHVFVTILKTDVCARTCSSSYRPPCPSPLALRSSQTCGRELPALCAASGYE